MFSSFRRPPHIHHPNSTSSHTGSSASGSVISSTGTDSRNGSAFRTPDTSLGYDSDAPRMAAGAGALVPSGWESDATRSKGVRWNSMSRFIPGASSKPPTTSGPNMVIASGYTTDAPTRGSSDHGHGRSRTYSSARKLSTSSSNGPPEVARSTSSGPSYSGDDFQASVERLLRISTRPFALTGTFPLFAPISLFFSTVSGSCHLLRFPSESSIPSRTFDAFMAACEPVTSPAPPPTSSRTQLNTQPASYHTFRNNPARPIVPSFDIAAHPILETVKRTLFSHFPEGSYLVATLNRVDVYCPGASSVYPKGMTYGLDGEEEPIAHVVVTLPVRFRGGMMSVSKDGNEERFWGRGTLSAGSSSSSNPTGFGALGQSKVAGSIGNVEWVAYVAKGECETKVEKVEKGVRINLVYDVKMKMFGPFGPVPRTLITPNDNLLASLSSVLKRSRGMKLAFYLTNDYGITPSHALAETVIPLLRGCDSSLYHALKFYNLQPTLRYTAGGYIWPATSTATIVSSPSFLEAMKRLQMKSAGEDEDLSIQIEDGGGVPLEREGIVIATGKEQGRIGKERVAFVGAKEGKLEYLHVNVCLVVYVH